MATLINRAMMNWLTIVFVVLFTFDALANAVVLSCANLEWSHLNSTAKFVLIAMVVKTWTSVMLAFFAQTLGRAYKGQPLIPLDASELDLMKGQQIQK